MRAAMLALLLAVGFAQAQEIPPSLFHAMIQEDANKDLFAVECSKGHPYVCVEKHEDSTTTYKELPSNREGVTFCYKNPDTKATSCQSTMIERPKRRARDLHPPKVDPNEPNHWEYMARVGVMPLMDAVDYEQHLATIYELALEPCYQAQLPGINEVILWLGRVDKDGRLTKTWVGPKSPFAECFSKKLKVGMMMGKPPKWDNKEVEQEGYPIRYEWNLRRLKEYWQEQEQEKK